MTLIGWLTQLILLIFTASIWLSGFFEVNLRAAMTLLAVLCMLFVGYFTADRHRT